MRLTLVAVAVMLLLVVTAGCGGKKKSAAPATTAAGSTTTSQATTTAASTTTAGSTTTTAAPTLASAKNCRALISLGPKIAQAMQSSSSNGGTSLSDEANLFKSFASAAPSDIRGDFETFASAFSAYAAGLSKAGYKPGKAPTTAQLTAMATAAKAFSAPKLKAAEQHLTAWSQKNCGGLTTTTPTGG